MKINKIEMNMSLEQSMILVEALDVYSRIGLGQFNPIDSIRFLIFKQTDYHEREAACNQLKRVYFPELQVNAYYGIVGDKAPSECQIAYDILQVVRHVVSWYRQPEGGYTINFNEPMRWGEEPLCTCEIIEGRATVLLSEKQAEIILEALDLYARLGTGQMDAIDSLRYLQLRKGNYLDREEAFERLKKVYFPELQKGAYYSIGSEQTPDDCKVAYDIIQVLRHDMSWHKEPEGGMGVNFHKPLNCSNEPLCSVSIQ